MMTIVGHSLVGMTIAVWIVPRSYRFWKKFLLFNAFILIAYLPDLPFPYWGHYRYHISHSIFVNLAMMIPLTLFFIYLRHTKNAGTYGMIIGGIGVWLTHFVLDSLYNHGLGIAIFWPISDAVLNLPIPWFKTFDPNVSLLSSYNLKVFGVEFLFYFPIFFIVLVFRQKITGSKSVAGDI